MTRTELIDRIEQLDRHCPLGVNTAVKDAFFKSERLRMWGILKNLLDNLDEDALTVVQLATLVDTVDTMVDETKAKGEDGK